MRVGRAVAPVLRRDPGEVPLGRAGVLHVLARGGGLGLDLRRRHGPAGVVPDAKDDLPAPAETALQAECSATGPSPQRQR